MFSNIVNRKNSTLDGGADCGGVNNGWFGGKSCPAFWLQLLDGDEQIPKFTRWYFLEFNANK